MASFTTTSNDSTNTVRRELSIASSFVKQYYTLLNKAPCFIHNFYSHDSTFIHGTVEMANEQYTEPVVGREKIKKKMEDLKLNDCRAKIKQIDCLETLAGGLVIQVIGELSNNGKPMRPFLQTFILAPSPDESRRDGDSRTGTSVSESGNHNQKFFVLNSIFRYQDDGPESEFEDDSASLHANTSNEVINGSGSETTIKQEAGIKQVQNANITSQSNGPGSSVSVERLANDLEASVKVSKVQPQQQVQQQQQTHQHYLENIVDSKRESVGPKVVSNGTDNVDKKSDLSDKSAGSSKLAPEQSPNSSSSIANNQPAEPKTWANMVRNAYRIASSSSTVQTSQQHNNGNGRRRKPSGRRARPPPAASTAPKQQQPAA